VITRALGPEGVVEVDTRSFRARPGDLYLLCSDGLTTMIAEEHIADLLRAHPRLRDAGEALIAAANDAGGRDNITVVLIRLEEVEVGEGFAVEQGATMVSVPAVSAPPVTEVSRSTQPRATVLGAAAIAPPPTRTPRVPRRASAGSRPAGSRRRRLRRAGVLAFALVVLGVLGAGAYLALQSVYFIGTNNRGLVTMFEGLPYRLPGDLALYSSRYVSGVSASTLSPARRRKLLNHSLHSEADAASLIRSLELGQLE
jgi:PPM family protein phosphatase